MSVKASNWAQQQTAGAAGRKATLLLLADVASPDGLLWAGVDHLAAILECDRTTVMRHLGELEGCGLVLRIERRKANGARTSTLTLLAPAGDRGGMQDPRDHPHYGQLVTEVLSRILHEPRSDSAQEPRSHGASTQVASCTGLGRTMRPEPLVEPSGEPSEAKASARGQAPKRPGPDLTEPPDGMPDELAPTIGPVLEVLAAVHAERGGQEPTVRGVGLAIRAFPDRDHLAVARSVEYWLIAGNGRQASCGDVTARFRTFLTSSPPASKGAVEQPPGRVVSIGDERRERQARRNRGAAALENLMKRTEEPA